MMHSVLSITTRGHTFINCNNDVILVFPEIFKCLMFHFGDVFMYLFIGVSVKDSIDIMVATTAVNTNEFTCLGSCTVVVKIYSFMGMVASVVRTFLQVLVPSWRDVFFDGDGCWGNCKLWAFL